MTKCADCQKEIPTNKEIKEYQIKGKYGKKTPPPRLICPKCFKKRPRDWQILLGLILMLVLIISLVLLKRRLRK